MPSGLRNAGATSQRLVNHMFKEQIGRTMDVYVDDMLVKSLNESYHLIHLEESFKVKRKYGMKRVLPNVHSGSKVASSYDALSLRVELRLIQRKLKQSCRCQPQNL
ncbi:UNVERIFIED_CONTAM: hypothetical protein Sradi_4874000 [Sesamum radiatum]|uniref:Reverse transcriptase domain-containing protein n=1 Tax=Sesamum radiatum TaxID=300843 RepID=A0AAW2N289_SESRA